MMETRRGLSFQDLVADAKTRINEISADELNAWLAEGRAFELLDTREPDEFANGAIGPAQNVPRGIVEWQIHNIIPNQDAVIVAYCGGGNRSALAVDNLQKMGYPHVYSLAGGYKGWVANNA